MPYTHESQTLLSHDTQEITRNPDEPSKNQAAPRQTWMALEPPASEASLVSARHWAKNLAVVVGYTSPFAGVIGVTGEGCIRYRAKGLVMV